MLFKKTLKIRAYCKTTKRELRHQALLRQEICPSAVASDHTTRKRWIPQNSVLRVEKKGNFFSPQS